MLNVSIKKQFASNGRAGFDLGAEFTASQGITVLFGASGSGKTTTLRSIAGMVTPDAGRISLGDSVYFDSAARVNLAMQKRRVGFVFQDYLLFPHLTAAENVAYGAKARHDHDRGRRVEEMLKLVG